MTDSKPFYETKSLKEMSHSEWESLCDGCGRCCVVLLQDDETDEVYRTSVGCKLLDLKTVRCSDYHNRHSKVPGCVRLKPDNIEALSWMPETCAYRLIAEGKPLYDWHPLISGSTQSVIDAGVSVNGTLISEVLIDENQLEDYIIEPD
jgi:uncharacterized cysteine cluster protein YcgN (CxxCxxCC family)